MNPVNRKERNRGAKNAKVNPYLSARLPEIKEKFPAKSLGIFGSYVRNEQTKNSDLDILVEFDEENYPKGFTNA